MKLRLSVYLDPGLMQQLTELADRKEQPKSLVAEAAITSFLTPDEGDRREAAFSRRLDLLTRQIDRLERDHMISAEALALFVRFWLNVTSSLPESAAADAQAQGDERYELLLEARGQRLAKGQSLLREVSTDRLERSSGQPDTTTTLVF